MKKFLKKHWSNILFVLFFAVILFNPMGMGTKVRSVIIKAISFSPNTISIEERKQLATYNWNLMSLEGESFDFNRTKDRVVFVSFWATWCPPCVAEMPSIQSLYEEYGEKVDFILVSDESKSKISSFLNNNGYTLPVYSNVSSPLKELESSSLPTSFIIDKKGNIVVKKMGAADWDSNKTKNIINKLLSE